MRKQNENYELEGYSFINKHCKKIVKYVVGGT